MTIIKHLLCFLLALGLASCAAIFRTEQPVQYNVELNSGGSVFGERMLRDSTSDLVTVITAEGVPQVLKFREVRRISDISDPLSPPKMIRWEDIPIGALPECMERDRQFSSSFLETRLALAYRGKGEYTKQTAAGPQLIQSHGFSFSEDGTSGAIEAKGAYGWRSGRWSLGGFLSVLPTDGSIFLPLGIHTRYDLREACDAPNVFLDLGIPFDFQTGAPIFHHSFRRQRKYVAGGVGYNFVLSSHSDLSIDWGAQYMTLPLSEVDCCPGIPKVDRFPNREVTSIFLAAGISF